jgi:hypothetical protein
VFAHVHLISQGASRLAHDPDWRTVETGEQLTGENRLHCHPFDREESPFGCAQ